MLMKYEDMLVATTDLFGLKFNKKIDKEKGSSANKGLVSHGMSYDQEKKKQVDSPTGAKTRQSPFRAGHNVDGEHVVGQRAAAMDEDVDVDMGMAEPGARFVSCCISNNSKAMARERNRRWTVLQGQRKYTALSEQAVTWTWSTWWAKQQQLWMRMWTWTLDWQRPRARFVSCCISINSKVKSVERKHTASVVFVPKGATTSRTDQSQSIPSDRGRRHAYPTSSARSRKLGKNYARP